VKTKQHNKAAFVWIFSGIFLLLYGLIGLWIDTTPGVEQLIDLLDKANGWWLYIGAAIAIFIEGLYIIGNLVPGSTLVLLLAVFAGIGGTDMFLGTILAIFIGWVVAGFVNIYITAAIIPRTDILIPAKDRLLTTWYPAFRANYEVAQVASGVPPFLVLLSSIRVKAIACVGAGVYALILPYFIDITAATNEEGFWWVIAIALISIAVGVWEIRKK
jgi:hypothetical protein